MASEKITAIVEELKVLTVLELSELVKAVEEEFGVSAAAAVAVAAPVDGGAAAAEEKTEFDVVLTDVGANKIAVIKVVREITGLGLAESKAMVDGAPSKIKEAIAKEAAEEMVKCFLEVIVAPDFTEDALKVFETKKNLRIVKAEIDGGNSHRYLRKRHH